MCFLVRIICIFAFCSLLIAVIAFLNHVLLLIRKVENPAKKLSDDGFKVLKETGYRVEHISSEFTRKILMTKSGSSN
jgi:hypothetical protein